VAKTATWQFERPLPIPRDQRAWDTVLGLRGGLVAVETETRPRDVQELMRRLRLKHRDDASIARMVLVMGDSRHNRHLLREYADVIAAGFPSPRTDLLRALAEGVLPDAGGVLLL
jgi:hypothetical protein